MLFELIARSGLREWASSPVFALIRCRGFCLGILPDSPEVRRKRCRLVEKKRHRQQQARQVSHLPHHRSWLRRKRKAARPNPLPRSQSKSIAADSWNGFLRQSRLLDSAPMVSTWPSRGKTQAMTPQALRMPWVARPAPRCHPRAFMAAGTPALRWRQKPYWFAPRRRRASCSCPQPS